MPHPWSLASVRCPKCGKILHDETVSRTDEVAICPDCGDLILGEDVIIVVKGSRSKRLSKANEALKGNQRRPS